MAQQTEKVQKTKNITEIYVFDEEDKEKKQLIYKINKRTKEIHFYPKRYRFVEEIILKGFVALPDEFAEKGYIKSGVMYYLSKMLEDKNLAKLTISRSGRNSFRKRKGKYHVVLSYPDFQWLKDHLGSLIYESNIEKSNLVTSFFATRFPRHFTTSSASPRSRAGKVIKNLDTDIIEHLSHDEVSVMLNFFEKFLMKKYKSKQHRHRLFRSAKLKVDDVAITDIVNEFEKKLDADVSEKEWGDFLRKNLFLVDSKYVQVIPELNVVLAVYRKVDFGLVDSQGYMDIFEIKKPSTQLLAKTTDRGNYYWSTDAIKALVQAEKYLFNADRKAPALTEDIKREKKLTVEIVKPRAILLMGHSDQLYNEDRKKDFRVLRMSLKNIEVILYDELLERIKLQKGKIYSD